MAAAVGAHDVGDQAPVAGPVLADDDRRRPDRRVGGEDRLDLTGLDAETADLHLVVGAADNSSRPSAVRRTRSPVRYMRSPGAPDGQATKRSAVSPGRPA